MRDEHVEWERFAHPDPDEEDPPTPEEIQILREFVYEAIAAHDAARRLMPRYQAAILKLMEPIQSPSSTGQDRRVSSHGSVRWQVRTLEDFGGIRWYLVGLGGWERK